MSTDLPKTHDSSGDTDSNSNSENSSSSDSSGSDWECSSAKQSSARKPHFSVTSCDTGLKLKIAAIPPRKASTKKSAKPTVKKKLDSKPLKSVKDRPISKKNKSQLSDSSSSSDSCSKCSSDSSSDDDLPLKAVSKNLISKCLPQKTQSRSRSLTGRHDSDDEKKVSGDIKDNLKKDRIVAKNNNTVKKTKSDESNDTVKRGRGRPRSRGNHGANLLRHFYSQHRAKYDEIHSSNLAAKENTPPQTSTTMTAVMQCCTKLVTDHGRPFNMIEDKAFRDLLKLIPGVTQNQHQAINIKNVRSSIQDMAHEVRGKICNEIKSDLLALKVDVASIKLRRFLGLNIQYVMDGKIVLRNLSIAELHDRNTGQYLKDNVALCLSRYGIELHQIQTITTDNGANMISMTNQINQAARESLNRSVSETFSESDIEIDSGEYIEDSFFQQNVELEISTDSTPVSVRTVTSVRCAAHCLQLAVKDACQEIEQFLGHCRGIVRSLRTPTMAMRLKELKLQNAVIDTPIRWDSTADMLESLHKLKDFCIANFDLESETIWNSIENYLNVLQPCRILSKRLQMEQLTFGDFYIAWMKCRLQIEQLDDPFALRLLTCLSSRQETLFSNEYFLAAIYLDPRVNATLTTDQQISARAVLVEIYKRLTNLKKRTSRILTPEPSTSSVNYGINPGNTAEINSCGDNINFDNYLRMHFVTNRHTTTDVRNLLTLEREVTFKLVAFIQEPVLPSNSNILDYWEQKKLTDPYLYQLAKVVLATPPTSVSVERLFSSLKFVLNNLRMSLSDSIIDDVLLVRNNNLFS